MPIYVSQSDGDHHFCGRQISVCDGLSCIPAMFCARPAHRLRIV